MCTLVKEVLSSTLVVCITSLYIYSRIINTSNNNNNINITLEYAYSHSSTSSYYTPFTSSKYPTTALDRLASVRGEHNNKYY